MKVFSKLWFNPIDDRLDPAEFNSQIRTKAKIVTDVETVCPDVEWLLDLLKGLLLGKYLIFIIIYENNFNSLLSDFRLFENFRNLILNFFN